MKAFASRTLLYLVITMVFIAVHGVVRGPMIESAFNSQSVKTTAQITAIVEQAITKNSNPQSESLKEHLVSLHRGSVSLAMIAISGKNNTLSQVTKNDTHIMDSRLYDAILTDFTNGSFDRIGPSQKEFFTRSYPSKKASGVTYEKFYITKRQIEEIQLLVVFAYQPPRTAILQYLVEAGSIIIATLIFFIVYYTRINKKKGIPGKQDAPSIPLEHAVSRTGVEKPVDADPGSSDAINIPVNQDVHQDPARYLETSLAGTGIMHASLYTRMTPELYREELIYRDGNLISVPPHNGKTLPLTGDFGRTMYQGIPILKQSGKEAIIPIMTGDGLLRGILHATGSVIFTKPVIGFLIDSIISQLPEYR